VILSLLVLMLCLATIRWLGPSNVLQGWMIGLFWVLLSVMFQFSFGHFALGVSWERLLAAYDPSDGNLWVLVLLTFLISPIVCGKGWGLF
jgi:hypothetical protein